MLDSKIKKNIDAKFMSLALRISQKNLGVTSPNPVVGCVIVKNNTIIATGVTAPSGRPHAEVIALEKAKNLAIGTDLYVTLEPCCHENKINPCTDLIIKAGIKKVIIATIDPDPRTSEIGIKKLKQAGIEVEVGVLENEAREINAGFFMAKKMFRPLVTLKLATSLDGKIANKNFDSKWITNEKSRQYSHLLRSKNDAILIGSNTAKKDDPMLDCRIPGLENFSPKRIIVSAALDIDLKSKIVQSAKSIPTYIATKKSNENNSKKFIDHNIKMIFCEEEFDTEINFENLLNQVNALGINNLLVEGGNMIATKLLQRNLVDNLIWIRSNFIIGNDGIAAVGNFDLKSLTEINDQNLKFNKIEIKEFDDDVVTIYRNQKYWEIFK